MEKPRRIEYEFAGVGETSYHYWEQYAIAMEEYISYLENKKEVLNQHDVNIEIKNLKWRDNITDIGKSQDLFEIISDIKELGITYHIRNYKYWGDSISDKYYFFQANGNDMIECDTVESAKIKAQEFFKQTVLKLFFK